MREEIREPSGIGVPLGQLSLLQMAGENELGDPSEIGVPAVTCTSSSLGDDNLRGPSDLRVPMCQLSLLQLWGMSLGTLVTMGFPELACPSPS